MKRLNLCLATSSYLWPIDGILTARRTNVEKIEEIEGKIVYELVKFYTIMFNI